MSNTIDEQGSQNQFDVVVPAKERFFYAFGDLFGGGAQALITSVYVVFLVLNGVSVGLAGSIAMVAKIWDAITDPLMGVLSDNTRTKWGRRRPYIFAGGLMIIFSFAMLFLPLYTMQSAGFKYFIYLLAFIIYSTVSTVIHVPYSALSTELTSNYTERNKINALRLVFSMLSSVVSAGVPIVLVESMQKGKLPVPTFSMIMIFVFGIFYAVPLVLTAIFSRERVPLPVEKNKFSLKNFLEPLKVKAFVRLIVMYFCAFACMDLINTNIVFLVQYGLKTSYSATILLGVIMVSYAAMLPYHNKKMKTVSKAVLFRRGIPMYIVGIVLLTMFPTDILNEYLLLPIAVVVGVGLSGCQLLPWYIFPDVVDIGELKFGKNATGSFGGIMTFIRKSTSAVAIGLSGLLLELCGFKPPETDHATGLVQKFEQSNTAVWGLKLVIAIPVIIALTFAFIAAKQLKITPETSKLVAKVIALKKDGKGEEALTPDEATQLAQIKKDLF